MQFTHILALFAATAVFAAPQGLPDLGGLTGSQDEASPQASAAPMDKNVDVDTDTDTQATQNVCGNGNKLSCCNSQSPGTALNILGSLCSLQVPVAGVPVQSTCGAQQPMCCSTNQDGTLNVGQPCIPVSL